MRFLAYIKAPDRYLHPLVVNILNRDLERVKNETVVNFLNISKLLIVHPFVIKSAVRTWTKSVQQLFTLALSIDTYRYGTHV